MVISIDIGEVGAPIIGVNTVGITTILVIDGPIMVDQDLTVFVITQVGMTVIVITRVGIEVMALSEDLIKVGDLELSEDPIKSIEVIGAINDKLKVLQE